MREREQAHVRLDSKLSRLARGGVAGLAGAFDSHSGAATGQIIEASGGFRL